MSVEDLIALDLPYLDLVAEVMAETSTTRKDAEALIRLMRNGTSETSARALVGAEPPRLVESR